MMNSALHRIARVTAICTAMTTAPILFRRRDFKMTASSMGCSSLCLELPGGLNVRRAPRGIQPREGGGAHRQTQCDRDIGRTEMREPGGARRNDQAHARETESREREADEPARETHDAGLHQALAEDGPAICAEGTPHADVAGAVHDFGEHQSHGVEQADEEKAERDEHENPDLIGYGVPMSQPFFHVAQARAWRPMETAGALLIGSVIVEESSVAGGIRRGR